MWETESESHLSQGATEIVRAVQYAVIRIQAACSLNGQKWEPEEEDRKQPAHVQIKLAYGKFTDRKSQISCKEYTASLRYRAVQKELAGDMERTVPSDVVLVRAEGVKVSACSHTAHTQ